MDDFFSYLIICVCIVGIIILMKKGKDGAGPNSRFGNFRNILLFVVLGIALQFISSSSYAVDFSGLFVCNPYPCAIGRGYDVATNNLTTCDPSTSFCNSRITYSDIKYTWIDNNNRFYQTQGITNGTWNTGGSPLTIGVGYNSSWNNSSDYSVYLRNSSSSSDSRYFPGISYKSNGEGIDFSFVRGSEGKIVYSVPSNTAFILNYQGVDYTINKVFFYPNRFIFANSDLSFMFEVGAGGYVGDGFFVMNPSYSQNNLYFVQPSVMKAWSTTISSTDAWNLLLGNQAYSSKSDYNWSSSYTLTTVAGGSIFPSGFASARQDGNIGFSYTLDLQFESPNRGTSGGGGSSISVNNSDFYQCINKYGTVVALAQQLQELENNIGIDYDYTGYLNIYNWVAQFDGSYTGSNVQINNYTLSPFLVQAVNNVWTMSQESPHAYVFYLNQAISNKLYPQNIITTYCGSSPDSQVNTSLISALEGVLDAQGNVICKTNSGANVYQNDLEQIIGSYNYYKVRCDNNIYAPTPYDNGTGSTWSLSSFWTWIQNGVSGIGQMLGISENTNNANVCAYANYLEDSYYNFLNSVDCSTCNQSYITSLQHDYQADICDNPEQLLENSTQINAEALSGTIHDGTNDNVSRMAGKLLDTFKTPYMSGYRAVITPTCYYGQDYERANYLLYGIFGIYLFILFKLLH